MNKQSGPSPENEAWINWRDYEDVALASLIRNAMINSISKTGGHIGANLALIEFSIALHRSFNIGQDITNDNIFFDTGHQAYSHKILTGRWLDFSTLNQDGGMSRFASRQESKLDMIEASHAGTAISIASGFSRYKNALGIKTDTVVLIGDGSLSEGMTLEALLELSENPGKIILVLNDNDMAIAPTVGAFRPGKEKDERLSKFFSSLGLLYLGKCDGHDFGEVYRLLGLAKSSSNHCVVHLKTEKGRGLDFAKHHPYRMHFSLPFNSIDGSGASPTIEGETLGKIASERLESHIISNKNLFVLTPATPYASYLDELRVKYANSVIDVGMSEQHCLGVATGLALAGAKVVICIQSTFLQRAYDQLIHDIAYMRVPVLILVVRSGLAGLDSPTHHGLFDLAILGSIPNVKVIIPRNRDEAITSIDSHIENPENPTVLLLPYFPTQMTGKREEFEEGYDSGRIDVGIICTIMSLDIAEKTKHDIEARDTGIIVVISVVNELDDLTPISKLVVACNIVIFMFDHYVLDFLSKILVNVFTLESKRKIFVYSPDGVFPASGSAQFSRASYLNDYNSLLGNVLNALPKTRKVE